MINLLIEEYTKQLCKTSLKLTCIAFLIKEFSPNNKNLKNLPLELLQDLERYDLLLAKTTNEIPVLHYIFRAQHHHIEKLKCLRVICNI